jgi:hypothetical protein
MKQAHLTAPKTLTPMQTEDMIKTAGASGSQVQI